MEAPPVVDPGPLFSMPVEYAPVDGNKDPMRFVAPMHTSGWAVASGYLGLFSVLLVFAPFALLTGILAMRDLTANPGKTGRGRAIFGIIMGVFGTLILMYGAYMFINNPLHRASRFR